jgi:Fe-S cluster assembly ATP-binding protein
MLDIKDLRARVAGKEILRGINLHVGAGEVHAIMGPNGSGKSTLAHVLSGRENYEVTSGSVTYLDKDLLAMSPEMRAREGVFLAFQYPVEIPGVSTTYFLKAALNAVRKHRGLDELDAMEFLSLIKAKMKLVEMGSTKASPAGKRSATRFCRWRCSTRHWRCSMKPIPDWISTPCVS